MPAARPPIPDVYVNIIDGGIGILPAQTANVHAKIGPAQSGEVGVITPINSLSAARAAFGAGPLPEACAIALQLSGSPIYAIRTPSATPGAPSAVTHDGTGAGTVSVTGQPVDVYDVEVTVTASGNPGAEARFTYSLDGGNSVSPEAVAPLGTYVLLGTGMTITFSGALVAGDTYRFTTTGPAHSLADVQAAMATLMGDRRTWGWVHVLGPADVNLAAALSARMAEAENRYRYSFAELEARGPTPVQSEAQWMQALVTEWQDFSSTRVGITAGLEWVVSPLTGLALLRPAAWTYVGRLAAIPVHEHPGRVARGAIAGVAALQHDENAALGLDQAGFTTMRSFFGLLGLYVTNGRLRGPETSDYQFVENRRVMDLACTIARVAALRFLNDSVRVDPSTGAIIGREAAKIEAFVNSMLFAGLIAPGHASAARVRLDRDVNVLSSRWVRLVVSILPLAYLSWIEVEIGFENPAVRLYGASTAAAQQALARAGLPREAMPPGEARYARAYAGVHAAPAPMPTGAAFVQSSGWPRTATQVVAATEQRPPGAPGPLPGGPPKRGG